VHTDSLEETTLSIFWIQLY